MSDSLHFAASPVLSIRSQTPFVSTTPLYRFKGIRCSSFRRRSGCHIRSWTRFTPILVFRFSISLCSVSSRINAPTSLPSPRPSRFIKPLIRRTSWSRKRIKTSCSFQTRIYATALRTSPPLSQPIPSYSSTSKRQAPLSLRATVVSAWLQRFRITSPPRSYPPLPALNLASILLGLASILSTILQNPPKTSLDLNTTRLWRDLSRSCHPSRILTLPIQLGCSRDSRCSTGAFLVRLYFTSLPFRHVL